MRWCDGRRPSIRAWDADGRSPGTWSGGTGCRSEGRQRGSERYRMPDRIFHTSRILRPAAPCCRSGRKTIPPWQLGHSQQSPRVLQAAPAIHQHEDGEHSLPEVCRQMARPMKPTTPIKPRTVATIRLRARPITNQSRERRIWPPSSGINGKNIENAAGPGLSRRSPAADGKGRVRSRPFQRSGSW